MLVLLILTGIYIEKLYTITLSDVVLLPATGVSTTTFNKKVLVVIYNPTMASGKKLNIDRGWPDPITLTNNIKTWFSNTSSGRVDYQLTFQQINDFTTLEGDQKYTPATYLSCLENRANCKHTGVDDWLDFDYNKFFTDNQICTKANAGTIDEVWVWGGPYFGYWESTLLGPQSKVFWYNSSGYINDSCSKLVPIMGFNYERNYELALESYAHRVESTMNKVYGNINNTNPITNWDKFVFRLNSGNPTAMNGTYGCGNVHYTANSTVEYKYDTASSVKSYCDTYLNYPNISSSIINQENVNSSVWGSDQLGYFTYWFKHIPNKSGCGLDKKTNDWWEFIIDPNNVYLSENTNCTPSATSTITPSPNVSVLVTVTNAPTITSTIDPSFTITNIPTLAISPTNLDSTPKITPTIDLSPVDCGALDVNDDDKLNLFDFITFSKVYNKQCKDNYPSTGCGAKDSNADGMINIMDFVYFAKHYHTRTISCSVE
jgi:hypothetical protein